MNIPWKSKKRSYEEYYKKKQGKSKRVWMLVLLLLVSIVIILGIGMAKNNEHQERLMREAEQYNVDIDTGNME